MQVKRADRADVLLKKALVEARALRESRRADSAISGFLGRAVSMNEAVDSIDHVSQLVGSYHYLPDPVDTSKPGRSWFRHDGGSSLFVYFDPTVGVRWNHYEGADKTQQRRDGVRFDGFRKGEGIETLEGFLNVFHTEATR